MGRIAGLILMAAVIALGCKKTDTAVGSSVQVLDASKLRPAFASSPAETQAVVESVMMSIQGSDPVKARSELDRLAGMPGVTDAQKAVIKDLDDQLDKKIAANANATAPK
jgi:hypothetical protein